MSVVPAAKHTTLAALTLGFLAVLSLAGSASGAWWGRDKVPPSEPGNLHVRSATSTLVDVAWEPAHDDVGVVGYYVYGATGREATVTGTSYTFRGLDCGESTAVAVVAFDRARNRSSPATATVSTTPCLDIQPPTTPSGFQQTATTQDSIVLAWAPSSDDVGVVGYGVYEGLMRVATTAEPTATLAGLSCGSTYALQVDAVDAAGNRSQLGSAFAQTSPCDDREAPTTPADLAVTSQTETSVSLSWSPSTDAVGVAGYHVTLNGAPAGATTGASTTLSGLECGTAYAAGVRAFDAAGNESQEAKLDVSTSACPLQSPPPPADTTSPSTPTGLNASNVTEGGLDLTWAASSDDVGVTGYDVYRDGIRIATVASTSSSQAGLSCGTSYAFAIVARDAAGNESQQAKLDASTSACPAQSPPPPPADTTPPTQPSNLTITSATTTTVSLTWSASLDDAGVAGYRTYVNGSLTTTGALPEATVTALSCGTAYTFGVDAYDAAGNHSTIASLIGSTGACADTQPPTAPTNVVASSRTATSITLSWSASTDNVGVTGYGLYRGAVQVGTSTSTTGIFSGLSCNTNYTLAVDAYDASGNHSTKTVVMVSTTACTDTTPPSSPTGLAASNVTDTALNLSWNASTDNIGVTGYDVFRNGAKVATTASTSASQSGLACETSYTFGVVARDAAGNSSPQTQIAASTAACAPSPPASGTVYVDPNGSDTTGTGTQSKPWKTLAKAVASTPGGAGNTIHANAGTYVENSTVDLPCKTNLEGAGSATTELKGAADPLIRVQNCTDPGNAQTVSGLKLDGQGKTAGVYGMRVSRVRGLTITGLDVQGFRGPPDAGGGGIDIAYAWDLDVGNSTIRDNGRDSGNACSGNLGLGEIYGAKIHDLVMSDSLGAPSVKNSITSNGVDPSPSRIENVDFYNLTVRITDPDYRCALWNALAFELYIMDAVNVQIRNSTFNGTVSLIDPGSGSPPLSSGYRYWIHNNRFEITSGNEYAIELDNNSSIVSENYFNGGLYPVANFFSSPAKSNNSIHHNVVDNIDSFVAMSHYVGGLQSSEFFKNTIVVRAPKWGSWDSIFKFDEGGFTDNTVAVKDNIFYSVSPLGDKLGSSGSLGAGVIDHNSFLNITPRGTNTVAGSSLPLSGGFPNAYIPAAGTAAASVGAFSDGMWSAG